jgi:high-affinity iron transporter
MLASLLITLREGLEAALILGIMLAYLAKTGNRDRFSIIWLGTALAAVASALAGAAIFVTVGELRGAPEQIFEGCALLLAVAMLSYMVVWMKHQASGIKAELQGKMEQALRSGSGFALLAVAFVVVAREGVETALFLFASTQTSAPLESLVGGVLGLLVAGALGYFIYRGSRGLNLRAFFNVTGALLVVFAAGLLARGIGEFQEASLLPGIVEHLWDISWLIAEDSTLGRFLSALIGYAESPSLSQVAAYVVYLAMALNYFFRHPRTRLARASARS